jgi:hypothetical protein
MSMTERENKEPSLAMPYTEIDDPNRPMLRRDKVDPNWNKSSTEIDEPMRVMPKSENVAPRREIVLRDNVAPS